MVLIIAINLPPFLGQNKTFLYAKIDKDSLLKNTMEPRLILIGGSNLALGLNCQIIEDSLNVNPINTGLDCNIGLSYMIKNTMPYIKKNDIVIVCIEFEQFFDKNMYGGYPSPIMEFSISRGNLSRLDFNQCKNLFKQLPSFCFSKLKIWNYFVDTNNTNSINYKRNSFNKFGDHVTHWDSFSLKPKATKSIGKDFNSDILYSLIQFNSFIKTKNANLFISFPPFQKSSFDNNELKIKYLVNEIEKSNLHVISDYKDYIMPDKLMFDSPYHLIKEGVDIRTNRLINDLKKVIK